MIARYLIILLLLFTTNANATAINVIVPPSCVADFNELPIVMIKTLNEKGVITGLSTAFLVARNKWATAAHSIWDADVAKVELFVDGEIVPSEITGWNKHRDIAIVTAESPEDWIPMKMAQGLLYQHTPMWNIGFPEYNRPHLHSYGGMVLRLTEQRKIRSNALAIPGMSGGPAVYCDGDQLRVYGVIISYPWEVVTETIKTDENGHTWHAKTIVNSGTSNATPITGIREFIILDRSKGIIWKMD